MTFEELMILGDDALAKKKRHDCRERIRDRDDKGCLKCTKYTECADCYDCHNCHGCTGCACCVGLENGSYHKYVVYGVQLTAYQWQEFREKQVNARIKTPDEILNTAPSDVAKMPRYVCVHPEKIAKSLDGLGSCTDCLRCARCVSCFACRGCGHCTRCRDCTDCNNCRTCAGCWNCASCVQSVKCIDCTDCWNCKDCMGCVDSKHCTDCTGCLECRGCMNCVDCAKCTDCIGLVGGLSRRYVAFGTQLTKDQWGQLHKSLKTKMSNPQSKRENNDV